MTFTVIRDLGTPYTWLNATNIAWNDPGKAGETLADFGIYSWGLSGVEPFGVADSIRLNRLLRRLINEALRFSDRMSKTTTANRAESLVVFERLAHALRSILLETFIITEQTSRGIEVLFKEAFSAQDHSVRTIGLQCVELVAFAECYIDRVNFIVRAMESVGVADSVKPAWIARVKEFETFGVTDHYTKSIIAFHAQPLGIADTFYRRWQVRVRAFEQFRLESRPSRSVLKHRSEIFGVRHTKDRRNILKGAPTFLQFTDEFKRSGTFKLLLAEAFLTNDKTGFTASINPQERMRIYGSLARAADLVISDMLLSTGEVTLDSFANAVRYGRMPGYANWRDFVPGDYEYREAMFRAVLESKNSDRGLLTNIQAIVDVPDIIDRGSSTILIPGAGVRVPFGRKFHVIPDVTVTTQGGVGIPAIPTVTEVDLTGFHVIMRTPDGNDTLGVFAWAAHGY